MDNIRVLFVNRSDASNSFNQEREKVLAHIKSLSNLRLQESDSIEYAQKQLDEIDILIMWVDSAKSEDWKEIDSFIKEKEMFYVGFIIIFSFDDSKLLGTVHEALLQKKRAFVCPINLFAFEASITALAEEMKYKKSLENFKSDLLKAENLNSILEKALDQLHKHPLVGYERATISLVDNSTKTLKRYLLKFDDKEHPNNQPKRRLQKDIQDDKLMMKVHDETVFIIQNLDDKRKDPSVMADLGWDVKETTTKDIKSWIGLAAKHQNQTIAIITLDHTIEIKYQENNHKLVDFLSDFGEIFADAITDLFSKRNKRIIKNIISGMGNHLKGKELIKTILMELKNELRCDNCTYFLVSSDPDSHPDKEEVFLEEWTSAKDDNEKKLERNQHKFKKGDGIVGTVLETGKSRIVPHAIEDSKFSPSLRHPGDNLSLLAVPVIPMSNETSQEPHRIIGVISCYKEQTDYFTVYDRDLVEYIALSVATVIERTRTLEFLNDISSQMAELVRNPDKKTLLEQICQYALKLTSAGSASIHLLQYCDDGKYIAKEHPQYTYPPGRKELPPRLDGTGTTDLVIADMETKEFSEKLKNCERINDKGVKSKIVVPLINTDKDKDNRQYLIGALYLNKYSDEPFSEVEKFALELFACQAASIINDQNILSEKQVRADAHINFTLAIEEIASKDDIGLLLRDVARSSCALAKANFSFVDIYNNEGKPEVKAAWPEYILTDLKSKQSEVNKIGIIGLAAKSKKPRLIHDIDEEKNRGSENWQQYIEYDKQTRSELVVPIIDKTIDKVIGVINLEHSEPYAFSQLHQELIGHLAAQVAIAYQKNFININNRMLTSLQQSLLNIMSESPQNMMYKAVSATCEALEAKKIIMIPCKNGKCGIPHLLKDAIIPSIPKEDNKLIEVLKKKSLEVYNDPEKKDSKLTNFGELNIFYSFGLCLPFTAGSKKIGVVWILFSKPINEEQLEKNKDVYQVYVNQIALAYENATRFEELKNKETEDLSREIKTYSNDVRNEAITWFFASITSAILGFVFICFGVYLLYIGVNANQLLSNDSRNTITGKVKIDSKNPPTGETLLNNLNKGGIASTVAGVILEAVTILFFKSMKEANKRLDRYHDERVGIGKLSILLAATEQIAPESPEIVHEEKQRIIHLTTDNWLKSTNEVKNTDNKVDEVKSTGG